MKRLIALLMGLLMIFGSCSASAMAIKGSMSAMDCVYQYANMLNLLNVPISSEGRMTVRDDNSHFVLTFDDCYIAMSKDDTSVLLACLKIDAQGDVASMKMLAFLLAFDKAFQYTTNTSLKDVINYFQQNGLLEALGNSVEKPVEYCGYSFRLEGAGDKLLIFAEVPI